MRALLFTLISLTAAVALAGPTIYKWVDDAGVVHYSDQPHANAQKVTVDAPQTYTAGPLPQGQDNTGDAPAAAPYTACAIAQPLEQQDFSNVDALTIAVRTEPQLHPGDQVYITFDGSLLNGGSATGPTFTVSPVDRGTHTVQAVVRDSTGAVQCQTSTVTFNVRQTSIRNPSNPIRPH